jgi:hypothetical protein
MENNENNEMNTQPPKFDPAKETKQKLIFFIVAIVVIIGLRAFLGL